MKTLELCFYCEQRIADGRDHIIPVSFYKTKETVPACRWCNGTLGTQLFGSALEKKAFIQGKMRWRAKGCGKLGTRGRPKTRPRGRPYLG